jgi:hypothetical protein
LLTMYTNERITSVKPIYAKTGGKNGRHNDVTNSSNIMAVSYLAMQVFEYDQLGTQFRALPHAQPLPVLRFDHLPPSAFLKHALEVIPFGLKLSLKDWDLFKVIMDKSKIVQVVNTMKALAGKQKMPEDNSGE